MKPQVIFLVGPTAIGKTEIACNLAKKINAEIISCDSMQIYKGMDIITSKPALSLRKKIPHHLIGIFSPQKEYNVSLYRKEAVGKIKEIIRRKRIPLFVGGTGLYMSAIIDGIFELDTKNEALRQELYKQAKTYGSLYLYEKLKPADPEAAAKIHPHDTKRIIRALEVFLSTGKPISYFQKQREGLDKQYGVRIFCLNMKRDKLYQKIDQRVEMMFRRGLAAEVKKLLKLKLSKTASFAIGIKELRGYFEGRYDLEEAKRLMQRHTRNYAKRQLTWFRKDKRIEWVDIGEKETSASVAKRIFGELELS